MLGNQHDYGRNRPRWASLETRLLVSLALLGFVFAALKAWRAPITTDEAWCLQYWVSRGPPFIWTDYSHSNNHLLNTLAMWVLTRALGNGEIALRVPALLGDAAFLAGAVLLARQVIVQPGLRLSFVAVASFHPYLIDFGALARGYALGSGFFFLALAALCAALRAEASGAPTSRGFLGLASVSLGLSVASVPIMVQPAAAIVGVYLALARGWRTRTATGLLMALALPGAAVVAATYAGVARQMHAQQFYFGAHDWPESLRSLASLLAYEWPVPGEPFYAARNAAALTASGLDAAWLLTVALVDVATAARMVREPTRRAASLPGLGLAVLVNLLAIDNSLLGLPLPKGRTWLAVVPIFLLASFVAIDVLVGQLRGRAERAVGLAAAGVCLLSLLLLWHRFDFMAYWEWPEDAPLREVVAILHASHRAGTPSVSLEFPWPMHSPLLYYCHRDGGGALELRAKMPEGDADADYVLAEGAAARQRYAQQELVRDYPRSGVTLYRRNRAGDGALGRRPTPPPDSNRRSASELGGGAPGHPAELCDSARIWH